MLEFTETRKGKSGVVSNAFNFRKANVNISPHMHDFRDEIQKPAVQIAILPLSLQVPKERQGAIQRPAFTPDDPPMTHLRT